MFGINKKPFEISIHHDDWVGEDKPVFKIPKKLHKKRKPVISLQSPCKTTFFQLQGDGSIEVYRGLEIWKGTFFSVKVIVE